MAITPASNPVSQTNPIQLHDIHLPEQINNFPMAPGWWILVASIIIAAIFLYKRYKNNTRLNANKKQALLVIENNENFSANACISLLKWAAIQYFSRQKLAQMYGDSLLNFLTKQLPEKHQEKFTQLIKPAFAVQYQVETTSHSDIQADCQQATKLWLKNALPVKSPQDQHKIEEKSS